MFLDEEILLIKVAAYLTFFQTYILPINLILTFRVQNLSLRDGRFYCNVIHSTL